VVAALEGADAVGGDEDVEVAVVVVVAGDAAVARLGGAVLEVDGADVLEGAVAAAEEELVGDGEAGLAVADEEVELGVAVEVGEDGVGGEVDLVDAGARELGEVAGAVVEEDPVVWPGSSMSRPAKQSWSPSLSTSPKAKKPAWTSRRPDSSLTWSKVPSPLLR
jgi:hypothetical protein